LAVCKDHAQIPTGSCFPRSAYHLSGNALAGEKLLCPENLDPGWRDKREEIGREIFGHLDMREAHDRPILIGILNRQGPDVQGGLIDLHLHLTEVRISPARDQNQAVGIP